MEYLATRPSGDKSMQKAAKLHCNIYAFMTALRLPWNSCPLMVPLSGILSAC